MKNKRWSGRFFKNINDLALTFSASIGFDKRLAVYDIIGSIIHVRMLGRKKIIKGGEAERIERGLKGILRDTAKGKLPLSTRWEDIHMNIEKALIKKIGPVGGKLHTARSRNDQVALDLRLYLRDSLATWLILTAKLEKALLAKAKENIDVIMPGYTHLQRAQPILFSHHLLAYIEMLERDRSRIADSFKRINILPLGASAMAGTTFNIDREFVAKSLGFDGVCRNSIDAVSDRDFAIEAASCGAILMMHLSRLAEELVLWSSSEFNFISLPEDFCTGSSIMPQKMNPDIPELVRGKTGRVYGTLISLLTMMKGLPLAYNKDMQEDKEPVFDLVDTVQACITVMEPVVAGIKVNRSAMNKAAGDGNLIATDIADFLVTKGVDFRTAHETVASLVRYTLDNKKGFAELSADDLKSFSKYLTPSVQKEWTAKKSVEKRGATGGTAPAAVKREMARLERRLASL